MSQPIEGRASETVTLRALFAGFLKVSLRSFGGGLVWARQLVVEQQRWMSEQEFVETLTLCELLPGPNIVGIAVCVGSKLRGLLGVVAAISGFVLVPTAAGFSLGVLYLQYAHIDVLQNILSGVAAAAAGLLIGTGLRLMLPHLSSPPALLFATLAFVGLGLIRLPLLLLLLGLAPVSIAVAGIARDKTR